MNAPGSGAWGRQLRAGEIAHFRAQDVKQAAGAYSWELDGEETEPWGVKGQIERQSTEIADALFQNLRAIEDAVAATLVPEFKKLDARINELENEKAALEQTLLAWRDFFGVEANHGRGGGRGDFATVAASVGEALAGPLAEVQRTFAPPRTVINAMFFFDCQFFGFKPPSSDGKRL